MPRPRYLMHMPQVLLALNCRSLMATVFWLPCVQARLRLLAPLLPYEQAPWAFWPTPVGGQGSQKRQHGSITRDVKSNNRHAVQQHLQRSGLQQEPFLCHQGAD